MKIWVAYMVPKYDSHMVYEDGLGYMEVGGTEAEARNKLEAAFLESLGGEDTEEYREIRFKENRLHAQEIEI